jgi:hypothetical protein
VQNQNLIITTMQNQGRTSSSLSTSEAAAERAGLMLLLPRLPTVTTKSSFRDSHTGLLWFCAMVMLRIHSSALVCLAFPSPPPLLLSALNLPRRLAAVADALLGMLHSDLLLLLLLVSGVQGSKGASPRKRIHYNFEMIQPKKSSCSWTHKSLRGLTIVSLQS